MHDDVLSRKKEQNMTENKPAEPERSPAETADDEKPHGMPLA